MFRTNIKYVAAVIGTAGCVFLYQNCSGPKTYSSNADLAKLTAYEAQFSVPLGSVDVTIPVDESQVENVQIKIVEQNGNVTTINNSDLNISMPGVTDPTIIEAIVETKQGTQTYEIEVKNEVPFKADCPLVEDIECAANEDRVEVLDDNSCRAFVCRATQAPVCPEVMAPICHSDQKLVFETNSNNCRVPKCQNIYSPKPSCPVYMPPLCPDGTRVVFAVDANQCDYPRCEKIEDLKCVKGNLILGDEKSNILTGTTCADIIRGRASNDLIDGKKGADDIKGGKGNDLIQGGRGDDTIRGNRGNDALLGGKGNDDIAGGKGNDLIAGGRLADVLKGNKGNDLILGGKGNDELRGGKGSDSLAGGKGQDEIHGGKGSDTIRAGPKDTVYGGAGKDNIVVNLKEGQSTTVNGQTVKINKNGDVVVDGQVQNKNTVTIKGDTVKVNEVKPHNSNGGSDKKKAEDKNKDKGKDKK